MKQTAAAKINNMNTSIKIQRKTNMYETTA